MSEPWIITVLIFASTVLGVFAVFRLFGRDRATAKQINRRLSLIEGNQNAAQVLELLKKERGIASGEYAHQFEGFQRFFIQSGLRFGVGTIILSLATITFVITLGVTLILGFYLVNILVGMLASVLIFLGFVHQVRKRRIAKFSDQLPEVLDIVVRSLKAGHPLPVSLSLVARELEDPAGSEFGIASDEVTYGSDLKTAIENLSARVGDPDLMFMVTSISIQSQTGGNLGEILSRLSRVIRERAKLRRKVQSLTAEGRFSAIALTALPLALFGLISFLAPDYFGGVWNEPLFPVAMGVAGVLLIIGNLIMRKMVAFKY